MARLKVKIGNLWVADDVAFASRAAALADGVRRGFDLSQLKTETL